MPDRKMCSHTEGCELFPLLSLKPQQAFWMIKYCQSDYTRCARYQLAVQGKTIPLSLLPNGRELGDFSKKER